MRGEPKISHAKAQSRKGGYAKSVILLACLCVFVTLCAFA
jgi:hypothetical protein